MEQEKGWEKLYTDAYNFIQQEMTVMQDVYQNNNQQEQVFSYNMQKINMIIERLNLNLIQNTFNKSFSYFGVILNKLGERCINYFCLLIIWRFICYSQWQSVNIIINELNQKKQNQLEKAFAYLQENKHDLSKISANELFKTIKENFEAQFYINNDDYVSSQINNVNYNPIRDLDDKLNDLNNKDLIINYIKDQKSIIKQYVDDKLNELKSRLRNELQTKLSNEYQELITKIKSNAQLLNRYISPNLNIKEYFENTEIDFEKTLFDIVVCFLQGRVFQDIQLINCKQRYIFFLNEKVKVEIPLNNLQNPKIQLLDVFIKEFIRKLEENEDIQLNLNLFKKEDLLFKKKMQMIGCEISCQFCKRKCDLPYQHQYNHECLYGHFYIVNMNKQQQQFTCDEYFIWERQRQKDGVKSFLNGWDIKSQTNQFQKQKQQLKQNLNNIWKEFGKEICQKLKKPYSQSIEQNKNKIHYIFILDSSLSMEKDWTNIQNGVRELISKIIKEEQNNTESKISLIIFNDDEKTIIKSKKAKDIRDNIKMNFLGGGTNFSPPIKKAIEIIKKDISSELYLLLFYTDGKANKPEQELEKIKQLDETKRKQIQLIACTQNNNNQNQILNEIVQFFDENTKQADLFTSFSADELIKLWSAIINFKIENNSRHSSEYNLMNSDYILQRQSSQSKNEISQGGN